MCQVFGQFFGDMTFKATDIVSELVEKLDPMLYKIQWDLTAGILGQLAWGHLILLVPGSSKVPFRKKQYSELLGAKFLKSSNPIPFVPSAKACWFMCKT